MNVCFRVYVSCSSAEEWTETVDLKRFPCSLKMLFLVLLMVGSAGYLNLMSRSQHVT